MNANTGEQAKLDTFSNKSVHAIAGIGNPARFFTTLKTLGYMVEEHAFVKKDITFSDVLPVVMTEKDWVKCREFSNDNTWFLQVDAQPTADAAQKIDELLIRLGTPAHG